MNNPVLKTMLGGVSAVMLMQAMPAMVRADAADQGASAAQTSGENAPANVGLSEVIVTARRVQERLQDVPISITVFNQTQLTNLNVVNTQDLAAYTPSLSVNNDFGNLNTAFAMRGFVQDIGTQPAVGVFFADVVAPRGASNNIPIGDGAGPGMFWDLQNVQILKGPQGTLFGRNTTGGDILLVPQKPTTKDEGFAELSYGNYAMKRVTAVQNIAVNDAVRFRIGIDRQTRNGYETNDTGIGPVRFGDVDYTSGRASLVIDITPDLENYTIGSYTESNTNGDLQKLIACNPTFSLGPFACAQLAEEQAKGAGFYTLQSTLPNPITHFTQAQVINTTTWQASDDLTIKNIMSYAQLAERLRTALFGTNFSLIVPPYIPAPGIPFDFAASVPLPGGYTADESTATEELQFQGRALNDRLHWQGGFYEENVEPTAQVGSQSPVLIDCANSDTFNCINPLGEGSVNYTAGKTYYNDAGVYEQTNYAVTDTLKVTEGLRYTDDSTHNNSVLETYYFPSLFPNPLDPFTKVTPLCTEPQYTLPGCNARFVQNSHAPTWLLGVDYAPTQDLLVYGKYARGYRAGGVSPSVPPEFGTFQPEKVDSYEVGIKTTFHSLVSGTFDAAAFYNNFRDQQLQAGFEPKPGTAVSPASGILNAGKSRISGFEMDTNVDLFPGFAVDVNYTWLDTKVEEVAAVTTPASSPYVVVPQVSEGDSLTLSPRNKVSITGTYTLPLADTVGRVSVGANYTHTSAQITNYVDSTVALPSINGLGTLPPLGLLNLNASWNSIFGSHVDLSAFATNVTNRQYYTWVPGVVTTVGFETAELGQPRFYGVRIRYTW
ncbi:MAG TPA: TonB-dependent receptor [Steroidobacteraceae bacterium]|nr:TonB-dependent receptor [Steroidobacteraceae bacterium]